jgi:hypothetical protein
MHLGNSPSNLLKNFIINSKLVYFNNNFPHYFIQILNFARLAAQLLCFNFDIQN